MHTLKVEIMERTRISFIYYYILLGSVEYELITLANFIMDNHINFNLLYHISSH